MRESFFVVDLIRNGEKTNLGTVPTESAMQDWFTGAFRAGLLPNPPSYTDEIQVTEMRRKVIITPGSTVEYEPHLRWIWRLSWHQFDAKPSLELVQ